MKAKDIQIGKNYAVKVSGKLASVGIIRAHFNGGWIGVNNQTGREIRIRSAARLRYQCPASDPNRYFPKDKLLSEPVEPKPSKYAHLRDADPEVANLLEAMLKKEKTQ